MKELKENPPKPPPPVPEPEAPEVDLSSYVSIAPRPSFKKSLLSKISSQLGSQMPSQMSQIQPETATSSNSQQIDSTPLPTQNNVAPMTQNPYHLQYKINLPQNPIQAETPQTTQPLQSNIQGDF